MKKIPFLFLVTFIAFSAKAQIINPFSYLNWKPGCYYDTYGNKYIGVISWRPGSKALFNRHLDEIMFAEDSVKAKKIKINTDSITAFVMGADSFVISRAAVLHFGPVLQVMLNNQGKLKLYCYTHPAVYNTIEDSYYYGEGPKILTEINRKNFINVMSDIMIDKPAIVNEIKSKNFRLGSINDLVTFYNTGVRPKHPFFTSEQ